MQLALVYDAAVVGAQDWNAELGWFQRAVEIVGHKEVAYRLDVQPSNLTDAIHERERKDVKGKWISVVRHMVPEDMRAEYLRIVNAQLGYTAPKRKKPRSGDEQARDQRAWLKEHAPALLELMDKDIGP